MINRYFEEKRKRIESEKRKETAKKVVVGSVVGTAIGAGIGTLAGLLFAPKSPPTFFRFFTFD